MSTNSVRSFTLCSSLRQSCVCSLRALSWRMTWLASFGFCQKSGSLETFSISAIRFSLPATSKTLHHGGDAVVQAFQSFLLCLHPSVPSRFQHLADAPENHRS